MSAVFFHFPSNFDCPQPITQLMGEGVTYPRGPYPDNYHRTIREEENIRYLTIEAVPLMVGSGGGLYRVGSGLRLSTPLSENLSIGAGYINNFITSDQTFTGHRFELFLKLPRKMFIGQWRFGPFVEIPNSTSWSEIRHGGGLNGAFTQVDILLTKLGDWADLQFVVEAGIGSRLDEFNLKALYMGGLQLTFSL